ncbi:hypothetical protein ACIP88_27330 [Streptomyces uncialis]|uniref:hypothetical protein n=1 Tax=Streptomyces uncialis TaxID=1048205 RepID=UPI0038004A88
MRDAIAGALVRVLDLILLTRRTGPGRHSAAHFAAHRVHGVPEEVAADSGPCVAEHSACRPVELAGVPSEAS